MCLLCCIQKYHLLPLLLLYIRQCLLETEFSVKFSRFTIRSDAIIERVSPSNRNIYTKLMIPEGLVHCPTHIGWGKTIGNFAFN